MAGRVRMVGTAANALTALVLWPVFRSSVSGMSPPNALGWAAGTTALVILTLALAASGPVNVDRAVERPDQTLL